MRDAKKLLATTVTLICASSYAADQEQKGSVNLGAFLLTPQFKLQQSYDDNVLHQANNERDSWKTLISPSINIRNNFGPNDYRFGYQLIRGEYANSQADNYTDQQVWTQLKYRVHERHQLLLDADFQSSHDARGTRYSIGRGDQLAHPDKFKQSNAEVTYRYGGYGATGQLDLRYQYKDVDYKGDEPDYRARDRHTNLLGSTFYYKVAPNTDVLLDVSVADITYDYSLNERNRLDSKEKKALAGIRWQSSEATTGFAKAGVRRKDFDSAERDSFNGFDWEVGVQWQPVNYSHFELSTQSDIKETDAQGNFIEKRDYQINWQHDWNERFNSSAELHYQDALYVRNSGVANPQDPDRQDDIWASQLTLNYQFRRWLTFSLSYQFEQRDSNFTNLEFNRNQYGLSMNASL